MSHDLLSNIWFILWCVIWISYFIFDSYSLGIGMMFPIITKNRQDRNQLQEIIGPFWNGAEVWIITAAGATFAAFPAVYADMFSFLYVPVFLILFALIFRAVGIEFVHKEENKTWLSVFKWTCGWASFFVPFFLGILFSNLFYGIEFGKDGMEGTLLGLFKPYALLGSIFFILIFLISGTAWIHMRADNAMWVSSERIAKIASLAMLAVLAMYFLATANRTPIFERYNEKPILYIIPVVTMLLAAATVLFVFKNKYTLVFITTVGTIIGFFTTFFTGMYPNMLPSRINDAYSLTLYNSSSSQKTLQVMFIVACIIVPLVLGYQIWAHYLFRKRISNKDAKGYY